MMPFNCLALVLLQKIHVEGKSHPLVASTPAYWLLIKTRTSTMHIAKPHLAAWKVPKYCYSLQK